MVKRKLDGSDDCTPVRAHDAGWTAQALNSVTDTAPNRRAKRGPIVIPKRPANFDALPYRCQVLAFRPKCGARAKTTGRPCCRPVHIDENGRLRGRCYYHGGATPIRSGTDHPNFLHGKRSKEAVAARKAATAQRRFENDRRRKPTKLERIKEEILRATFSVPPALPTATASAADMEFAICDDPRVEMAIRASFRLALAAL